MARTRLHYWITYQRLAGGHLLFIIIIIIIIIIIRIILYTRPSFRLKL